MVGRALLEGTTVGSDDMLVEGGCGRGVDCKERDRGGKIESCVVFNLREEIFIT